MQKEHFDVENARLWAFTQSRDLWLPAFINLHLSSFHEHPLYQDLVNADLVLWLKIILFFLQAKKDSPIDKAGESPEKSRTCGINCAVCENHVQKSYSCCTIQTAPEKFKYLFTPGVARLKICRKCIPYKKVLKLDEPVVIKKKLKVKQKRGRKPTKVVKPTTVVKAIPNHSSVVTELNDNSKTLVKNEVDNFAHEPFTAILNPEHTTFYNGTLTHALNGVERMDYSHGNWLYDNLISIR